LHRERPRTGALLTPGGRFIATHFSHRNNPSHEDLAAVLAEHGITAAYDGMEVRLDGESG